MVRLTLVPQQVLIILVGSLVYSGAFATTVVFESDVRVKREGQSSFEVQKKDSPLSLKNGDSALVSTSQGLPLLIVTPKDEKSQIRVSDSDLSTVTRDQLQPALQAATSEIVDGLRKAEALIQRRDYEQALQTTSGLKAKYPRLSSILFTDATANYLSNNKAAAIESLERGLELEPSNASATKLLKKLKEGS